MRGISTVFDVAVFLLLVTAAVGTLVVVRPPAETDTSVDETAEVVATSTLSVEYDIRGRTRHAHGTAATLLARSAVASATFDGEPLGPTGREYRAAVTAATRDLLVAPNRTEIRVRWEPYRGAPVRGEIVVGPAPPPDVTVHTATLTVPAPVPATAAAAGDRPMAGYSYVAGVVAGAVADGLLPSTRVDASIARQTPATIAATGRYRTVAARTDAGLVEFLANGEVRAAHQRATDALARRFEADMRREFETPADAAAAVRTGTVRITVRRWEA